MSGIVLALGLEVPKQLKPLLLIGDALGVASIVLCAILLLSIPEPGVYWSLANQLAGFCGGVFIASVWFRRKYSAL